MRVYFWVCVAFFQATGVFSAHYGKKSIVNDPVKQTGILFASVIQNITRVNNELQKLINKYEYIQQKYGTQVASESETTDDEIDENFKNKQRSELGDTAVTKDKFAATEIIWEDEDYDNISNGNGPQKTEEKTKEPMKSEIIVDPHKTTKNVSKEPLVSKDSDIIEISELSQTEPSNTTNTIDLQRIKEDEIIKEKAEKEQEDDSGPLLMSNNNLYLENDMLKLQELRNGMTEKNAARSELRSMTTLIPFMAVRPKVEMKLFSETFSAKKIWDEIIRNKPIRLEAHTLRKMMKDYKSSQGKTAVVIITNRNKTKTNVESARDLLEAGRQTADVRELKATELRQAYGDACLKLVIKKCYKAMKAVSKAMCSSYRCKESFREKFLESSKTGCIKEFFGNKTKYADVEDMFYRADDDGKALDSKDNKNFEDSTREGYMRACLPHVESQIREMEDKESARMPNKTAVSPIMSEFNILRDRFEKACKEISTKKCVDAGKYATIQVCESFPCGSGKRRAYDKACRRECKVAYTTSYGGRSSSGSSSTSDSDSDSDSYYSDSS